MFQQHIFQTILQNAPGLTDVWLRELLTTSYEMFCE